MRLWIGILLAVLTITVQARVKPVGIDVSFPAKSVIEKSYLVADKNNKLEGNYRIVGRSGLAEYRFRCLGGSKSVITIDASGHARVYVIDSDKTIQYSRVGGKRKQFYFPFDTDDRGIVHSVRLRIVTSEAERFQIYSISFKAEDLDQDGDGIGDGFERLLGSSAGKLNQKTIPASRSMFETSSAYRPELDLGTDIVMINSNSKEVIGSWLQEGYQVYTNNSLRQPQMPTPSLPIQLAPDNQPIVLDGQVFLVPTSQAATDFKTKIQEAIGSGSSGIALEMPGYWVRAGYSDAFKQAWQETYHSAWQPPDKNVDNRLKAETLKSQMQQRFVQSLLARPKEAEKVLPSLLVFGNPVSDMLNGINTPYNGLLSTSGVTSVLVRTSLKASLSPVPYRGVQEPYPFMISYLQANATANLSRPSSLPLWLHLDALMPDSAGTEEEARRYLRKMVVAAMLHPQFSGFDLVSEAQLLAGKGSSPLGVELMNCLRALEQINGQPIGKLDAGSEGIGVLYTDSISWQRGLPEVAGPEDLLGLCLPLLGRGIPLNLLDLSGSQFAESVRSSKMLIVSYDTMKPETVEQNRVLANWVKDGGWLLVVGGTDAYNEAQNSWWKLAGFNSPTEALFNTLGIDVRLTGSHPAPSPESIWTDLARSSSSGEPSSAHHQFTFDLTEVARADGSVYVQFSSPLPNSSLGPEMHRLSLEVDGRTVVSFLPGAPIEEPFLYLNVGSRVRESVRSAEGNGHWIYSFKVPAGHNVRLVTEVSGVYLVEAAHQPLFPGRSLQPVPGPFAKGLPPLNLHGDEALTTVKATSSKSPAQILPLYTTLSADGTPAFYSTVGRGGVVFLGVSPRYFLGTEEGDQLFRAISAFTYQRTNNRFRERARFLLRRERYLIGYGNYRLTGIAGTYVNLFDSNLSLEQTPKLAPNQAGLWLDVGSQIETNVPTLLFTNAKIIMQNEESSQLAYMVTGPAGARGAMRLWVGRREVNADAIAPDGTVVPIQTTREKRSLLINWPMTPSGVVIRVNW